MARGFAEKSAGRLVEAGADIRAALVAGDSRRALHLAKYAYTSAAARLRRRRPGDGALTDAEMAGSLLAAAARLSTYKPVRRGGLRAAPAPRELLAAFERASGGAGQ